MAQKDEKDQRKALLAERYAAAMVLGGVGDALGYHNGTWEFCFDGKLIHKEAEKKGGIAALTVKGMSVSDDTVMHLATAEALIATHAYSKHPAGLQRVYLELAVHYIKSFRDMAGRAPGPTTGQGVRQLQQKVSGISQELRESAAEDGETHAAKKQKTGGSDGQAVSLSRFALFQKYRGPWKTPVARSAQGGGCGGCMRAVPIGLAYPLAKLVEGTAESENDKRHMEQLRDLIAISVESCRMTHNHPTGYLGTVAAALFTSLSLQGVPPVAWGRMLLLCIPLVVDYVESEGGAEAVWDKENVKYFREAWEEHLSLRGIADGTSAPVFPSDYDVEARDQYYKDISYSGWGGASGHDAPLIAYDALLGCEAADWAGSDGLLARGALHGGDSDSTAILACAWHGGLYGFRNVPQGHLDGLEYGTRLQDCARRLWRIANQRTPNLLDLLMP